MYSRINEKRIYVIDITFSINESIFSGNEQQKVYILSLFYHFYSTRNNFSHVDGLLLCFKMFVF